MRISVFGISTVSGNAIPLPRAKVNYLNQRSLFKKSRDYANSAPLQAFYLTSCRDQSSTSLARTKRHHRNTVIPLQYQVSPCVSSVKEYYSPGYPSIDSSVLQFWSKEGLSPLCKLIGNSAQVQAQCSNEATVGSCNVPVPLPLFPGTVEIWNNVSQDCHVCQCEHRSQTKYPCTLDVPGKRGQAFN